MGNQLTILFTILMLTLSGCASFSPSKGDESSEAPSPSIKEAFSTPFQDDTAESTTTPFPPNLQYLIVKATEDLAKRLSTTPSNINLKTSSEVIWQDSSLGCPQPGVEYLQVLTEGYLLFFEADNKFYQYHTDSGEQIILCDNLEIPIIPVTPGDIQDGIPWVPVN